ncbi:MAG TPA: hypothetical protein GXZ48_02970 [Acholeplasmataceae bacterium]|nr:hypothetical protein [Acholeplasmataceae bacterium]
MKKLSTYLNIISICIYVIFTIITTYLLVDYITGDITEGSGIIVLVIIILNIINCILVFLLNLIGLLALIKARANVDNNQKQKYKRLSLAMIIMIWIPILTFIIQLIII